ncbi:collagen alpha-1(I) chain-like [Cervus canadensis]|uniref:collagen alpha-1(I) chain-like n=1 Tax=Cervus canadensis TaxID=1574408 RepID=UPI001C9E5A8D|nr:collagen alpha-1(I) chain-like [Cervus canadensis]
MNLLLVLFPAFKLAPAPSCWTHGAGGAGLPASNGLGLVCGPRYNSWGETKAQTSEQTTELGAGAPARSGGVLGGASLGRTASVSALGAEASPSHPCMVLSIKDLIPPEPAGAHQAGQADAGTPTTWCTAGRRQVPCQREWPLRCGQGCLVQRSQLAPSARWVQVRRGAEGPVYADERGDEGLQATRGPLPLPGPSSATPQSPGDLSGSRERVSAPGRPGSRGKWLSGTASSLTHEPRPLGPVTPKPGTQSALGTQRSPRMARRGPGHGCPPHQLAPGGGPFPAARGRAVNLPAPHISGPHSPVVSPFPREQRASQSNLSLTLSSLNKDSSFQHETGAPSPVGLPRPRPPA